MFGSLRKSISKTFSRATEFITGNGPTPAKQFRNAIVDGDEEKAINLYISSPSKEGDKCLHEELHPSAPFPFKKNVILETPISLASKYALEKLLVMLLERGGDPGALNSRQETCIHIVCSLPDKQELRATIIEHFMSWNHGFDLGIITEKVSVNKVDIDGNTAIHNAASMGLMSCVEKLIYHGAIISIVNKGNNTCCEIADTNGHKDLAMMLELALVFQPEEFDLSEFDAFSVGHTGDLRGKLYLDTHSLTLSGINSFVEEAITSISVYLGWMQAKKFRCRAEALLNAYAWDVTRLRQELIDDGTKVLVTAKMDVTTQVVRPTNPVLSSITTLKTSEDSKEQDENGERDTKDIEVSAAPSITPAETTDIQITLDDSATNSDENEQNQSCKPPTIASEMQDTTVHTATVPEPVTCTICCEEMLPEKDVSYFIQQQHSLEDQGKYCLTCLSGHSYCLDCWSSHVHVQVSDNGLGCLPCPGYKCGEILDISWASVLLKTQDMVNRLKTQRIRHVIDYAGLKYCSTEGCGLLVHIPKSSSDVSSSSSSAATLTPSSASIDSLLPHVAMCDNNHMFCVSCLQPAHAPCTCTNYPQWFQLVQEETKSVLPSTNGATASGDDIANALWVAANTKRCPRCATAIEKDEGCNHMSCRKCRKEFCWICMQDWSLHSENTGGYFQCNRFQDTSSANANNGDSAADPWTEERGNAHADAARMRQRNRTMARFIHHFTRFQAHGQSFQMESRMSKETYKRIEDGLKMSVAGHLKWLPGPVVPNPLLVSTGSANASPLASSPRDNNVVRLKDTAISPLEAALTSLEENALHEEELQASLVQRCLYDMEVYSSLAPPPTTANLWEQHGVKPSVYLQFLSDGFHELLKCRQFLQWTYPYAYFEFQNNDNQDYSSATRRRTWQYRAQDHRTSFEFMQADLESTVETLSDVCARRRLRASRAQIIQATKAAKTKRIEFESLLLAYASAKHQHSLQTPPQTPSSSTSGNTNGRNTASASRSNHRHTTGSNRSSRSNPSSARRARLADDPIDEIANLIRDLELATGSYLSHEASTSSSSTRNDSGIGGTRATPPRLPPISETPPSNYSGRPPTRISRPSGSRRRHSNLDSSSSDSYDTDSEPYTVRGPRTSNPSQSATTTAAAAAANNNNNRGSANGNASATRSLFNDDMEDIDGMGQEEYDMLDVEDLVALRDAIEQSRLHQHSGSQDAQREDSISSISDATLEFLRLTAATTTTAAAAADPTGNSAPAVEGETPTRARRNQPSTTSTTTTPNPSTTPPTSRFSEARLVRLAQRAEEEEQLNLAILMSLRENTSPSTRPPPPEEHIATLVAMGFTREQSIEALQAAGGDCTEAIMRLVG